MNKKICVALLLFSSLSFGSQLDSKSLFIGMGIGGGTFVTRNYIALPVAKATKKASKKTYKTVKFLVNGKH
jgi:hypothetical protein